jgi:hypothetical protein
VRARLCVRLNSELRETRGGNKFPRKTHSARSCEGVAVMRGLWFLFLLRQQHPRVGKAAEKWMQRLRFVRVIHQLCATLAICILFVWRIFIHKVRVEWTITTAENYKVPCAAGWAEKNRSRDRLQMKQFASSKISPRIIILCSPYMELLHSVNVMACACARVDICSKET